MQYFLDFKCHRNITRAKRIINLLLLSNFHPVISHRRVEEWEKTTNHFIRFGHSLWSAPQGVSRLWPLVTVRESVASARGWDNSSRRILQNIEKTTSRLEIYYFRAQFVIWDAEILSRKFASENDCARVFRSWRGIPTFRLIAGWLARSRHFRAENSRFVRVLSAR